MSTINTAILIFNDVEVLDFTGPFEIFNFANRVANENLFNVFTVSVKGEEVITRNGLRVTPDYSIKNCPKPDILIVPGGKGRNNEMNNKIILDWISSNFIHLKYLFSICTGAFFLGKTGLLDGLKATTHHASYDEFESSFPETTLIRNIPFVDNGKIITSAGI